MRNPIFAKREVRQAMFHAVDRNLIAKTVYYGYARPGTSPIFSPNKDSSPPTPTRPASIRRRRRRCSTRRAIRRRATRRASALNLLAAGWFAENGKIGAIVKQGLEDVGIAVNLTVPDRPTSIKRIYTDYDFDLAISNQANPSEPVPSTTQYYTTDGIKKGVPFRNASGFSQPEMDALVEKIKVETDPAKRKALVIEFQKIGDARSAQPAAGRARIDHRGQHQGAEPLQRSELPRRELVRHMAGDLTPPLSSRPQGEGAVRRQEAAPLAASACGDDNVAVRMTAVSSRQLAALKLLRRRLIQAVPLMLGVVVINFVLIHLAPGSFLELMTAENQVSDPATVELLRKTYGLEDPTWLQLLKYIWALMQLRFRLLLPAEHAGAPGHHRSTCRRPCC